MDTIKRILARPAVQAALVAIAATAIAELTGWGEAQAINVAEAAVFVVLGLLGIEAVKRAAKSGK